MAYLTVVPYRNPLLQAKSMTSLDVLSAGRATFVLGTGYLRSEFAALGVDFAERNELFDEAVEVLKGIWSTDDFRYEGRHFTAHGTIIRPGPVQKPHPPLWLGGNAGVVMERVAKWGEGWAPLIGLSTTVRTRAIDSLADLRSAITELGGRLEAHGRALDDIDILAGGLNAVPDHQNGVAHQREELERLADMGVTWTIVRLPQGVGVGATLEAIRSFGKEVAAGFSSKSPAQ